MSKIKDMTKGKSFDLMIQFAVPLMLVNILQMVYTVVDGAVVGRVLGVNAFAAVGATASTFWMVMGAVFGITQGFGVIFAQRFGGKDTDGLRRALATGLLLSACIGMVIAVAGVTCVRYLLTALQTPPELMGGATLFLSILLGGMTITLVYNTLGAMLRALGDSKTPLNATIFSTLFNIVMDVVLVPPLGIAGAAIATLLAQILASVYCVLSLRNIGELHFTRQDFCVASAKPLLRVGLPLGLRNTVVLAGGLVVQRFINDYGAVFVAGVAAAKSMYSLLTIAISALESAVATFVAQNFGARQRERIRQGIKTGLFLMLASSVFFAAITLLFGNVLMSLLIAGEQAQLDAVLDVGRQQLKTIAFGLPALSLLALYRSALQGLGNTMIPTLSGFVELVGRFAAVFCLLPLWGIWGVYVADPMGWAMGTLLLIISYSMVIKRLRFPITDCNLNNISNEPAPPIT